MRLLIDANILLDVLLDRQPHVRDSAMVWRLCETDCVQGVVSALTCANLVYIMRKELDPQRIEDILHRLSLIFEIADLRATDLSRAAAMQWADYEDAVQSVTAERIHADYILTRNVRDYAASRITAFTPSEFLARI